MPQPETPLMVIGKEQLNELVIKINESLLKYSDKDWNYSRIYLQLRPLHILEGPYVLWFDLIETSTKPGKANIKSVASEILWGDRHSSELGILEIISLRINKALFEVTTDEFWGNQRPVLRVTKKELLTGSNVTHALWYTVTEVAGEEFENR